jgi:hypothetical protein
MKEFEIGEKVTWKIGTFICFGVFMEKLSDESSKVQCWARKEEFALWARKHICVVEVSNTILESDLSITN